MIASQTHILYVHKFTAGLDATWSVDTEFNIDLPSGDGRRADRKRTRDVGELVRRPDAVLVVDAKMVSSITRRTTSKLPSSARQAS